MPEGFDVETLTGWVISYGARLAIAALIFFAGKWLAGGMAGLLARGLAARKIDPTITSFVRNISYYALVVMVVIAALGQLGIQTASFVAVIGAAGLAVGFALQGSLSNFAAGVLLILFRPCKIGDFVEVAGVAGTVSDISIFATTILTGDAKTITVANSAIMGGNIVNYSTQPERRIDLVVGVSYQANIQQVKDELRALAAADARILDTRDVTIGLADLSASSLDFVFRPWVKTPDYWPVKFDLTEQIKERFDALGIGIPYPQMDVHVKQAS